MPGRLHLPRLARRPGAPKLRDELWNLPNILTYGRIAVVPFVMWFLYESTVGADPASDDHASRVSSFIACALFSGAAVTDFLDGWIARNWGLSTMVGRFLDPLADKIIVMACLVMLVHLARVPAWFVVLLISRELSITSLRSIATSEGIEVRVAQSGKWKTAFQLCGLVGLLTHYRYPIHFGFVTTSIDFNAVGTVLLALSMLFSIISAGEYFYKFAVAAAASRAEDARSADAGLKPPEQAGMVPIRGTPPPDAAS